MPTPEELVATVKNGINSQVKFWSYTYPEQFRECVRAAPSAFATAFKTSNFRCADVLRGAVPEININPVSKKGTPLINRVAVHGSPREMKYLVTRGIDPYKFYPSAGRNPPLGRTPFELALQFNPDVAPAIVELKGLDPTGFIELLNPGSIKRFNELLKEPKNKGVEDFQRKWNLLTSL